MLNIDISKFADKLPDINVLYEDIAQPSARKIGLALETLTEFGYSLTLPIKLRSEKARLNFEKSIKLMAEELSTTSENDIIPSPSEISVPIMEQLPYTNNDELRSLFVRLLVKSATLRTVHMAHPSFINVIKNLSEDEAKILDNLSCYKNGTLFPLIQYKYINTDSYKIAYRHVAAIDAFCLNFPKNFPLYFDNLSSLGIIQGGYDKIITDLDRYVKIDEAHGPRYTFTPDEGWEVSYDKGFYQITDYGTQFISACVIDLPRTIEGRILASSSL
ncbi:hypothetical protein BK120_08435 [Paenibacillus sp. FSL A5-0031]|uniref:DUF4393 domain-containing protein n=1 Tax=Paenibacillus sp. FSL A5-0031 TaxID=1920420 RepID=UPI00096CB48B|nr:DUF4393 domain-containing protein [Paenibacillus sp. FSL A5-0031]OME86941.1 hypothetical protein BK120_08435 [Paenibacillus sp. FSL A5-0031]